MFNWSDISKEYRHFIVQSILSTDGHQQPAYTCCCLIRITIEVQATDGLPVGSWLFQVGGNLFEPFCQFGMVDCLDDVEKTSSVRKRITLLLMSRSLRLAWWCSFLLFLFHEVNYGNLRRHFKGVYRLQVYYKPNIPNRTIFTYFFVSLHPTWIKRRKIKEIESFYRFWNQWGLVGESHRMRWHQG